MRVVHVLLGFYRARATVVVDHPYVDAFVRKRRRVCAWGRTPEDAVRRLERRIGASWTTERANDEGERP